MSPNRSSTAGYSRYPQMKKAHMVADVNRARHTPDVAFSGRRSDRLVIRRFRLEDAESLAAPRVELDARVWRLLRSGGLRGVASGSTGDITGASAPIVAGLWSQSGMLGD